MKKIGKTIGVLLGLTALAGGIVVGTVPSVREKARDWTLSVGESVKDTWNDLFDTVPGGSTGGNVDEVPGGDESELPGEDVGENPGEDSSDPELDKPIIDDSHLTVNDVINGIETEIGDSIDKDNIVIATDNENILVTTPEDSYLVNTDNGTIGTIVKNPDFTPAQVNEDEELKEMLNYVSSDLLVDDVVNDYQFFLNPGFTITRLRIVEVVQDNYNIVIVKNGENIELYDFTCSQTPFVLAFDKCHYISHGEKTELWYKYDSVIYDPIKGEYRQEQRLLYHGEDVKINWSGLDVKYKIFLSTANADSQLAGFDHTYYNLSKQEDSYFKYVEIPVEDNVEFAKQEFISYINETFPGYSFDESIIKESSVYDDQNVTWGLYVVENEILGNSVYGFDYLNDQYLLSAGNYEINKELNPSASIGFMGNDRYAWIQGRVGDQYKMFVVNVEPLINQYGESIWGNYTFETEIGHYLYEYAGLESNYQYSYDFSILQDNVIELSVAIPAQENVVDSNSNVKNNLLNYFNETTTLGKVYDESCFIDVQSVSEGDNVFGLAKVESEEFSPYYFVYGNIGLGGYNSFDNNVNYASFTLLGDNRYIYVFLADDTYVTCYIANIDSLYKVTESGENVDDLCIEGANYLKQYAGQKLEDGTTFNYDWSSVKIMELKLKL